MPDNLRRRLRQVKQRVRRKAAKLRAQSRATRAPTVPGHPSIRTPAAFDAWIRRGPSSRWSGFPTAWLARDGIRFTEPARVGVVMHVYYPELFDELLSRLEHIPVPFDLIVTNASGRPVRVDQNRLALMRNHVVLDIENHGRDIYPLVAVVNADLLAPYDLVLKVHTKRSQWRADHALSGDGASWRTELLDALIGDRPGVEAILSAFAESTSLGIVTAAGSALDQAAWGDNGPVARELLRRLEIELEPAGLIFAAGSMYWIRGFILQGLRGFNLTDQDFEPEAGHVNLTTAHALERVIGVVANEAGLTVTEETGLTAPANPSAWRAYEPGAATRPRARVVPFFLPQFHRVEENDAWWGPGFTEWTNVTAAKPVFPGHWQPKLPRELGFYDLSDLSTAPLQESLARAAGIEGFMYYHYWFSGQPILEAPVDGRRTRAGGLPFCLMWANENWTRRWDGRSQDVLLGQDHDRVPATDFIVSVLDHLAHPDYLRVEGRPVLAVYRPAQIPTLSAVLEHWRAVAAHAGVGDLFLLAVDVPGAMEGLSGEPRSHGFDGLMGFAPHNLTWSLLAHPKVRPAPDFAGNIFSFGDLVQSAERKFDGGLLRHEFPGVMVGFDNTARRALTPDLWFGSNPYTFRRWLAAAVEAVADRPEQERLVFINAWNEWAEGAMLEPSDKFGLAYLQAVRDVVLGPSQTDNDG